MRLRGTSPCAIMTLIAVAMMTDYTGKDIEGEYE